MLDHIHTLLHSLKNLYRVATAGSNPIAYNKIHHSMT